MIARGTMSMAAIAAIAAVSLLTGCARKVTKIQPTAAEKPAAAQNAPAPAPAQPATPPAQSGAVAESNLQQQAQDALQNIYFDFDKAEIKSDAEARLTIIGKFLTANPSIRILIGGNCDERGSEAYNMALGERRAVAAKNFLVSFGVSAQDLDVVSYGKERLAYPNCTDEACHAKNRRDEFTIVK